MQVRGVGAPVSRYEQRRVLEAAAAVGAAGFGFL